MIEPILPAVAPAATNTVVKLELPVRVEETAAYDRAANDIFHALRGT
jgi:hypothetical protein